MEAVAVLDEAPSTRRGARSLARLDRVVSCCDLVRRDAMAGDFPDETSPCHMGFVPAKRCESVREERRKVFALRFRPPRKSPCCMAVFRRIDKLLLLLQATVDSLSRALLKSESALPWYPFSLWSRFELREVCFSATLAVELRTVPEQKSPCSHSMANCCSCADMRSVVLASSFLVV